jgi:hypothetical protein
MTLSKFVKPFFLPLKSLFVKLCLRYAPGFLISWFTSGKGFRRVIPSLPFSNFSTGDQDLGIYIVFLENKFKIKLKGQSHKKVCEIMT